MTATHVTVQSGQKCNEHVSITSMDKRDSVEMLKFSLLPHLYHDIRPLSVQLLAAEVQSPAFTLHYLLTSAAYTVGAKERSEPETDYTFQSPCLHQLGNTKL